MEQLSNEHRTRLRYLLSSLEKRELENQAQYGVKAVLQQLTSFGQAGAVLKELFGGGGDAASRLSMRRTMRSHDRLLNAQLRLPLRSPPARAARRKASRETDDRCPGRAQGSRNAAARRSSSA
jgi:hypothetical protein